jgi:phosphoglycerol transferase MdoB-like AlkP superfamily enzyme
MAAEVNFNQKSIQKVLNLEQDDLSKATSTLRVPFILHYPGEKNGQTISNISSQIDVTPTTLNLLGINYSKYYFLGQDMLSNSNKKVIFPNGSFINQKVFYDNDSQQCFSISSKRKTNFSNCNPYINETSNELNVSETLIRKNLIEYLRKK